MCGRIIPVFHTPEQYIKDKLLILKKDFKIVPTEAEMTHLNEMKTEFDINLAVRKIIDNHLDK